MLYHKIKRDGTPFEPVIQDSCVKLQNQAQEYIIGSLPV